MYGPHNHNIYSIGIKCRSRPKNTNWKGKNYFFYAGDKIPKIPQLKFIPADVFLGHWYLAKFSLRSQNLLGWYIFMQGPKSNVDICKLVKNLSTVSFFRIGDENMAQRVEVSIFLPHMAISQSGHFSSWWPSRLLCFLAYSRKMRKENNITLNYDIYFMRALEEPMPKLRDWNWERTFGPS